MTRISACKGDIQTRRLFDINWLPRGVVQTTRRGEEIGGEVVWAHQLSAHERQRHATSFYLKWCYFTKQEYVSRKTDNLLDFPNYVRLHVREL